MNLRIRILSIRNKRNAGEAPRMRETGRTRTDELGHNRDIYGDYNVTR